MITHDQATLANLTVFSIGAWALALFVALRAWDGFCEGKIDIAIGRCGVALFLIACGCQFTYASLRWSLKASNNALTEWYITHASFTVWFGALATIGAIITLGAAGWDRLRIIAPALATCAAVIVWTAGLIR